MFSRSLVASTATITASLLLAMAGLITSTTATRAEDNKNKKPAPVQHAAPPPRPAPPAPRPVVRTAPPPRVATPTITHQQNLNANVHQQNLNANIQRQYPNANIRKQNLNANIQKPNLNTTIQKQNLNTNVQIKNFNNGGPGKGLNLANPSNPPGQGANVLKFGPGKPVVTQQKLTLKPGPGGPAPFKPSFPAVNVHNKFFPIHKGPKFIYVGGVRRFFVPLAALGVVMIGGSYWYPDGYVSIEQPYCEGYTPDGCSLNWRMVDFADGGGEPQCVQYCPQVGPPPAQIATLPPPPPPPPADGSCQVTIFAEPDFAGLSAPSSEAQPDLGPAGWQNEIASIQVRAGTWDFFTEPNYGGISMRLPAGVYSTLTADWTKKIGSFMCVQPGPGA